MAVLRLYNIIAARSVSSFVSTYLAPTSVRLVSCVRRLQSISRLLSGGSRNGTTRCFGKINKEISKDNLVHLGLLKKNTANAIFLPRVKCCQNNEFGEKIKSLPHGWIYYGSHIAQYIYPGRKRFLTTIYAQKVAFLFPQYEDFFPV